MARELLLGCVESVKALDLITLFNSSGLVRAACARGGGVKRRELTSLCVVVVDLARRLRRSTARV